MLKCFLEDTPKPACMPFCKRRKVRRFPPCRRVSGGSLKGLSSSTRRRSSSGPEGGADESPLRRNSSRSYKTSKSGAWNQGDGSDVLDLESQCSVGEFGQLAFPRLATLHVGSQIFLHSLPAFVFSSLASVENRISLACEPKDQIQSNQGPFKSNGQAQQLQPPLFLFHHHLLAHAAGHGHAPRP